METTFTRAEIAAIENVLPGNGAVLDYLGSCLRCDKYPLQGKDLCKVCTPIVLRELRDKLRALTGVER